MTMHKYYRGRGIKILRDTIKYMCFVYKNIFIIQLLGAIKLQNIKAYSNAHTENGITDNENTITDTDT